MIDDERQQGDGRLIRFEVSLKVAEALCYCL